MLFLAHASKSPDSILSTKYSILLDTILFRAMPKARAVRYYLFEISAKAAMSKRITASIPIASAKIQLSRQSANYPAKIKCVFYTNYFNP